MITEVQEVKLPTDFSLLSSYLNIVKKDNMKISLQ